MPHHFALVLTTAALALHGPAGAIRAAGQPLPADLVEPGARDAAGWLACSELAEHEGVEVRGLCDHCLDRSRRQHVQPTEVEVSQIRA